MQNKNIKKNSPSGVQNIIHVLFLFNMQIDTDMGITVAGILLQASGSA